MKKILIIILMLIMVTGVSSYESYNSYIEKELIQHNEFFDNFNLDKLEFNKNFITIISEQSLSTFDKNLILREAYKDSESEFEALTNRIFENYKTDDYTIAKLKNNLENEIIALENKQNNLSVVKSREKEYKIILNQLDEIYEKLYDNLYECDECYESKDALQFLEIEYTLISDKYVTNYLEYRDEFEFSIQEEYDECEDEEDKYDLYCNIKKQAEEFLSKTKELEKVSKLKREGLEDYKQIEKEIKELEEIKNQISEIHEIYKSNLEQIKLNQKVENLEKLKEFSNLKSESIKNYQNEIKRFTDILNSQINVREQEPVIELNSNYKNSIKRILTQVENSNEYKLKKLILINAILNSYNFYESNSELEKIYYEITNQILVKYYKQDENPKILKLNLLSDLKSLDLNFDKLKVYIETNQEIQLSSQKNYEIIIKEYQDILKGILNKLESEETYNLKYFEGQDPDKIQFAYENQKIEQMLNLILEELVKLKANEKLIVEEDHDLTIYKIKNKFLKDVLIWLEIYRPADRVAEIEKKNEAFLILDKESRFQQSDLFNLNQKEVVEISSQKLELINRIQNEISYFLSKDKTYTLSELEDFLNILDYYVFSKYVIEEDKNPFWQKIEVDNKYILDLNKLTYQKIDKLTSKNQQNYLKNNYNQLIKNRLNPNIYFIKIISEDNEQINLNSSVLGEKEFELLKYGFLSISQDYENIKLNKNNLYEDIANYDLNLIEESNGLFEKLAGSHNLDFDNEYKKEIKNVTAEDIVFLLRDRMNLKLIKQILSNQKSTNSKNLESYIEKVAELKRKEIEHILSSYFDSYTSDQFNQKYLELVQAKQVDPLINYLNNKERKYIFYELNKEKKQELSYNIKYDTQNSDLINHLLNNKRNGYIYSQEVEKEILESQINESINKILKSENNILELIKLDLLFQAHNYFYNDKYENLRVENQEAIMSILTGNSNNEQIKSAAKIESIIDPETQVSFTSSTNKLMAYLDLVESNQVKHNVSTALEIIKDMNKWIVSKLLENNIKLEKIRDPEYLYEIDQNESKYDNQLGIKIGNQIIELIEIHKKLLGAIDITVESDNYDHLFEIVKLSTVLNNKQDYKIFDRALNRLKDNKVLNLNEIKRLSFLTNHCKDSIINNPKVENNQIQSAIQMIFDCKEHEFEYELYDKELIYENLFELQKKSLKIKEFQSSSPISFIPSMIESINNTIILSNFMNNFEPKEKTLMDEFSIWLGSKRDEFENINKTNIEKIQQLNKEILAGGLLEKNFNQIQDRILFSALINEYLTTNKELFQNFALKEPENNRIFKFEQSNYKTDQIKDIYDDFIFTDMSGNEYHPDKLNNKLSKFVEGEIYFVKQVN